MAKGEKKKKGSSPVTRRGFQERKERRLTAMDLSHASSGKKERKEG